MGSSQLYSLTWGQFGTSLVSAVQLLRCHGDLVDVTLAAGGRSFPAHKVVLCAASPFLLELLKGTPCKHPIVMLAGVAAADLEALLEFVYRGEVSIDPNQLPSLLQAAHCLNIQGLAPAATVPPQMVENTTQQQQQPQQSVQHTVKTIIDVSKSSDSQTTNDSQDVLSGDDVSSNQPTRRRKRLKRKNSTGVVAKQGKFYIPEQNESDNRSTESNEYSVTVIEEGDVYKYTTVSRKTEDVQCQHSESTAVWTTQQLNLINASTSTVADANLSHTSIIPPPSNVQSASSSTKIKAASDQPGSCPLCGAMLRQARNLRRHLLTSCKYRMVHELSSTTTTSSSSPVAGGGTLSNVNSVCRQQVHDGNGLHQLQSVQMHNIERVASQVGLHSGNVDDSDKNASSLTHMSCADMIPTTSVASNTVE